MKSIHEEGGLESIYKTCMADLEKVHAKICELSKDKKVELYQFAPGILCSAIFQTAKYEREKIAEEARALGGNITTEAILTNSEW